MASGGMVQELERLRQMLDANPSENLGSSAENMSADSAYAGALNAAEVCARYSKQMTRLLGLSDKT